MTFDQVYCIQEVKILQSKMNSYAERMEGTEVYVRNNSTGTETLCGTLHIIDDYTTAGQTYNISCGMSCGDEVVLRVRHEQSSYTRKGCVQISEIEAYTATQSGTCFHLTYPFF